MRLQLNMEDAFSNESNEKKKEKLEEKHGIKMILELEGRVKIYEETLVTA